MPRERYRPGERMQALDLVYRKYFGSDWKRLLDEYLYVIPIEVEPAEILALQPFVGVIGISLSRTPNQDIAEQYLQLVEIPNDFQARHEIGHAMANIMFGIANKGRIVKFRQKPLPEGIHNCFAWKRSERGVVDYCQDFRQYWLGNYSRPIIGYQGMQPDLYRDEVGMYEWQVEGLADMVALMINYYSGLGPTPDDRWVGQRFQGNMAEVIGTAVRLFCPSIIRYR